MEKLSIEGLADRVERLEQENRWLKRFSAMILLGTGALVMHFTNLGRPPKELVAERFVVKDQSGHARATLSLRHDGQPALAILDEEGRDQIFLGSTADLSSNLEFFDRGRSRVSMRSTTIGGTSLDLMGKEHGVGIGLYLWPDQESGIAINRGKSSVNLALEANGAPKVLVRDSEGRDSSGSSLGTEPRLPVMRESPTTTLPEKLTTEFSVPGSGPVPLSQVIEPTSRKEMSLSSGGRPRPGLWFAP
jgi:hypothetical protein